MMAIGATCTQANNMVTRYDSAELLRPHRTPEGYLLCEGIAVKPGVYDYLMPDGSIRRELKPEDEIFHADSLASLGRKPITLDHPWKAKDQRVTADNVKEYGVGDVDGEIEAITGCDGYVRVKIAVRRADAVKAVESRQADSLSLGMTCEMDLSSGTWQGKPYDAVQRNIRYNHLALVEAGRVPDAHIRMDAALMVASKTEEPMEKLTVGGKEYDCPKDLAEAIKADATAKQETTKADEATYAAQLKKAKADKERMDGEIDGLKKTIADLEEKLKAKEDGEDEDKEDRSRAERRGRGKKSDSADDATAVINPKAFAARLKLVQAAERMSITEPLTKTDAALRKEIAEKAGAKTEGRTDAYVEAFTDIIIDHQSKADATESVLFAALRSTPTSKNDQDDRNKRYLKSQGQEV